MAGANHLGLALALIPFAVWAWRFLALIHQSFWAAAVFWAGVAHFQWQIALAGMMLAVVFLSACQSAAYRKKYGVSKKRYRYSKLKKYYMDREVYGRY